MIIKGQNITNLQTGNPSKKPVSFDVFILILKDKLKVKEMEICLFYQLVFSQKRIKTKIPHTRNLGGKPNGKQNRQPNTCSSSSSILINR